ncbi:hypothetical protein OsJ_27013 [Oryza sativa Japonica Group]|nr:hypothetical protein OsJ_27013 [Oryza sativa Japonica Group]
MLARISQDDALEPWDATLNRIKADKTRALLESINVARASASVDDDDGLNLQAAATCPTSNFDVVDVVSISHHIQYIGNSSIGDNQMQMTPVTDGINCK